MQSTLNEPIPDPWPQIGPLLDAAMLRLGEHDRNALLLRFFEGKDFKDVGAVLGATEDTARMRVNRALEKLRSIFRKCGVDSTATAIAESISKNSLQSAPAVLVKTTTAVALAKGVTASASTLTLTKGILKFMAWTKLKTTAVVGVAAVVIGTGAFLTIHKPSPTHFVQSKTETIPVKLPNDGFEFSHTNGPFVLDVDPTVKRTPTSQSSAHIKSQGMTNTPDAFIAASNGRWISAASRMVYRIRTNSLLLGKHVRISGWVKTRDVANWAGATIQVYIGNGHVYATDEMCDRPARGTSDWEKIEFVTDIPNEPAAVVVLPTLNGPGDAWFDDFQIEIAPDDLPATDDRTWQFWSPDGYDYSMTTDTNVLHDDHPTMAIRYTGPTPPLRGSQAGLGKEVHDTKEYAGHTVRMSVWMRTANLGGHGWVILQPQDASFNILAKYKLIGSRPTGSTDWTLRTVLCQIPPGTQYLNINWGFYGIGEMWIDTDSFKLEIADEEGKTMFGTPANK